ncbi:hypothetical protein BVC80_441g167 [Macleaya cordata]|uniref:Uncharacterized protein n=1 Tax=Macleaya cordata TaxID=56857 RepID=A0A200Q4K0_MACCD|nr:hypothetical protein BVC80_441g167 [Macleaya cordata]
MGVFSQLFRLFCLILLLSQLVSCGRPTTPIVPCPPTVPPPPSIPPPPAGRFSDNPGTPSQPSPSIPPGGRP